MDNYDNSVQAFFGLVKAGLWEKGVRLFEFNDVNYSVVYEIAEEQTVVGLVAAGLEHVQDVKVPKEISLLFVGSALQLEHRNLAMNEFVAEMTEGLRKQGIYTLLVKGQGIAQCYERPLWRSSGDVDFLCDGDNYRKAASFLTAIASEVAVEDTEIKHLELTIVPWSVEIHGTLKSRLWGGLDNVLDEIQHSVLYDGAIRSWLNGKTEVFLPRADEDVVFVFAHILQHFFLEGIGLRQICDWCRLLWKYRDSIDRNLLLQRLQRMKVMTEWKTFSALAVDYIGMSEEALPFYRPSLYWSRKANLVVSFVLETGSFGHNRDYSYQQKYPFLIYKTISLWRHIKDTFKYFMIFPIDSVKVLKNRLVLGVKMVVIGSK